ncbi:MAG: thioredoxin family protein [Meiothermus sp.]|uniref:monothiol bacilliredoxin BrxC family protein n=1 Tax=Meiothermus sp. TaxID=1955249 RepID=UPI0025F90B75|nr:monothiol bacilliredoxin BrxC family protein [Meiothermus sp.]MCS7067124.1 thioredoxin family protein [Meiothermus sp.]
MSLRERVFSLKTPEDVDAFLERYELAAIFKASTSDKTLEAMQYVQKYLEPRPDVAIGIIRIPEDRPASNHVEARTGIQHQSPQLIVFRQARPLFDLDNWKINPEHLEPLLLQALPVQVGRPVHNPAVVGLHFYRDLLDRFIAGALSEERFQWGYLDRLKKEADWRSDEDFSLLNSLFPNPDGRAFTPGKVVALEFQAQLAGKAEPLLERARRLRDRLEQAGRTSGLEAMQGEV